MDRRTLTDLLTRLAAVHSVPGAQLAVRWRGEVITAEIGVETSGTSRVVTAGSAFPVGSLTKPFTATAAMMLVADGDLELDEPIGEYLREVRGTATGQVTLRGLLSHTAGLAANVDELPTGTTRRRWAGTRAGHAVAHQPGTAFSYANTGYLLAGLLVEEVTGMGWREAVQSMVLRPLDIKPSFVLGPVARGPITGHAVLRDGTVVPVAAQTVTALEEPVAALAASATDLVRFAEAHLPSHPGPGLLDPGRAKDMRRDVTAGLAAGPFGLADGWGAGWSLYRSSGPEWFGHDGTGDGAWSHLRVEPDSGTVVALLTNANTGVDVWEALVAELGIEIGHHSMSHLVDPGDPVAGPTDAVGRYTNGSESYTVTADAGRLHLAADAEPSAELTCYDSDQFTTTARTGALPLLGRFLRHPGTGEIHSLQVTGRLARRT
ncbi:CubicO group peptidase (beta-lactamase class C family) [Actinokineospora cianjurensis]|uniref:CubicO group peptidase (Beta-lactamase class C family) n=1 Tax=Actinokineospora cianjurensis TaxID=585224 RepID=A0A421B0V3_9PSEU|nr:CubicO group peptidase (beta-lactamase class C family) [Actinokineospora cianjurensis]